MPYECNSQEMEILECKEFTANKENFQKDGKAEIKGLHQERDELIMSVMSLFENMLLSEILS